jgi:thymidylate synthase (FAD)
MTEFTIKQRRNPEELIDVLEGSRAEVQIHQHGLIALVDSMPRLVPKGGSLDTAVVQAARVSYGTGTKSVRDDRALIRYLMRHAHTSPFEMVELKFHVVLPIFVARQWVRHRTASINEYSGRYSIMPDRFYRPEPSAVRLQSATNKQGGTSPSDDQTALAFDRFLSHAEGSYQAYEQMLESGVARELARIGLPQSLYTEWYWKCDLHNIFHFLELRLAEQAQSEIREYAQAMLQLVRRLAPESVAAFEDYRLHAVRLSRLEVDALRSGRSLASDNRRESQEWEAKMMRLKTVE